MPMNTTTANSLLDLLLRATTFNDIAENDTSSPMTTFDIALHSSDPGAGGSASTNEIAYTSYARVSVARSTGFSAASGGATSNAGTITFPTCTGGSATATHFSVCKPGGGAAQIIVRGALNNSVAISLGNPVASFAAGELDISLGT